ncbi:hypothetical protein OG806_26995 [Streptomyces sp. NBC_00882]|uniref:hypothetical protein n=1 Tax=Streptomyces TaxID=1883 RepID=UPI0038663788|nr:hypothetical protein OG806_26995 [Streptomyces sp. NBC_00882]WSZ59765.1 hypothetical protein OH824_26070 [Streptomyces canus]
MAGLSGAARAAVWASAGLCAAVLVGLAVVAAVVDLDTADRAAGVVGAVLGAVGLLVSVYALFRPSPGPSPSSTGTTRRVRSRGRRAMAAGGDIKGNAFGTRSTVRPSAPTPAPTPAADDVDVQARGRDALGAAGDITRNAFGDDSRT